MHGSAAQLLHVVLTESSTINNKTNRSRAERAAATAQEQEEWVQLDHNLKHVLIITTTAAAATLCKQYQHEIGLEIYRQLLIRFRTPLGTRSIGYQTKLLEPALDTNNFEESFSNWEYEIQQYESDNSTNVPDQVKVAVLMNRTRGPLQQHLPQCRSITNVRRDTDNNHRIPKSTYNLQQVTTESIISSLNKLQWRSSTNGHRSNQQRKVERKRKKKT